MRTRVFFSYLLIAGGLVCVAFNLVLFALGHEVPGSPLESIPILVGLCLALLLVRRVPANRMSFLLSLIAFTGASLNLGTPLVEWALDGGREVLAVLLTQLANMIFPTLIVSLLVLLPLWFPTGRAITPRWEWVWRVTVMIAAPLYVLGLFTEKTCVESPDGFDCLRFVETPWGIQGLSEEVIGPVFLMAFGMAIPAVFSLILRFRRARGIERQQLRFFVLTSSLMGLVFLGNVVVVGLLDRQFPWSQGVFSLVLALALTSIAMAVLKYRLYDIDRIISRTVAYLVVVVLLGAVFALGVVAIPNLVIGSGDAPPPLVVAASTLLVAALFNPLRRRISRSVDRRFNRSRYDAEQVIDQFGQSLRDGSDTSEVLDGWVGVVSDTMEPSSLGVWLRE